MKILPFLKTMALCLLIMTPIFAAFKDANARERHRNTSGSYTNSKGRSGTYQRSTTGNLKDGLNRNQSITTDSGKTFNRNSTTTHNKETGEFQKTVTGAKGNTRTYTGTAQDGQRTGSYTTSNGKSGTFNSGVQRNEDGTVTRSGTWTNQDGATKSRSAHYNRENGTINRSVTGPDGNTREGSVTFTPNAAQ